MSVRNSFPCLPWRPVSNFLLCRFLNNFLEKQSCPETCHCVEIFFIFQDFWASCACPEKQSVPWNHCIEYIFLIIQNFEQHTLALKNRVCPEIFHCIEIFFIFQDFWTTCACPENRVYHEFFDCIYVLFTIKMFEQLLLTLKNRVCLEFTVLNMYFYRSEFWTTCACPENRVFPEIFHCIEYSFYNPLTPTRANMLALGFLVITRQPQ